MTVSEAADSAAFFRPTTVDGAPLSRRRSIVDRQATAQRFLFEAADDVYDGELDINWDAPPAPDRDWLRPEMVSLHGTRLWKKLTPPQRHDLGRRELANLLTITTYAATASSMWTFRETGEEGGLVDDRARWQLKMINTQSRNITMFGRLIDTTGVPPYTRARLARRLEKYTLLLPAGLMTATVALLLEAATQGLVRFAAGDPRVQPHVHQIASVHLLASRRHLAFAQEEFDVAVAHSSKRQRVTASIAGALVVALVGRLLINPQIYLEVGVSPRRAGRAARRSASNRLRMSTAFADALAFCAGGGLFDDPVSRAILRRAHAPQPARQAGEPGAS